MKRILIPVFIAAIGMVTAIVCAGTDPLFMTSTGIGPSTAAYQQFNEIITGDWQQYGQLFTSLQAYLFSRLFLLVVTFMPVIFFFHYIAIGPKKFDHRGKRIYYFSIFNRIIHWLAAFSFSLLVITGLLVILGKILGGGAIIRNGRSLHILSAIVFTISAVPMLLMWLKNMLPALYDIRWLFIMGGYLNTKKKPIPAGKFNAGQKMWFWLATMGGFVMAYTGYFLWGLQAPVDDLRLMAIIHNFLGAALVALFLVHLYMSLFAITGSLGSMINGYKPKEEVDILHSRYKT
ncbi:MAG TPA: formate dehydrogenase subunit gamma [Desulfocapsa sulfexigens]|nr:formate dehydrogenase subunit gamma [Desulfocapsa sulfexigens]